MAMHVCKTPINAVVPESQPIVSNPKQVKNGRVDVVDRGWVITMQRSEGVKSVAFVETETFRGTAVSLL